VRVIGVVGTTLTGQIAGVGYMQLDEGDRPGYLFWARHAEETRYIGEEAHKNLARQVATQPPIADGGCRGKIPGEADVRTGSIATEMGCPRCVRSYPVSYHIADIAALPKSAKGGSDADSPIFRQHKDLGSIACSQRAL
jgi:hypothetical protein